MTNIEAIEWLKRELCEWEKDCLSYHPTKDALNLAIKALESQTEVNVYDKEETYHGCTVQVLTNTVTGQTSVGWWKEEKETEE